MNKNDLKRFNKIENSNKIITVITTDRSKIDSVTFAINENKAYILAYSNDLNSTIENIKKFKSSQNYIEISNNNSLLFDKINIELNGKDKIFKSKIKKEFYQKLLQIENKIRNNADLIFAKILEFEKINLINNYNSKYSFLDEDIELIDLNVFNVNYNIYEKFVIYKSIILENIFFLNTNDYLYNDFLRNLCNKIDYAAELCVFIVNVLNKTTI